MILPDVNVLVYAFRRERREHAKYADWLQAARAQGRLALVETVLLGVIRVSTNPRAFADPAPTGRALAFVEELRATPGARHLAPTGATWDCLRRLVERDRQVRGRLIPDAWLAALAISHGARVATADRGFGRFPGLDFFDPISA
ncbi:MAG TPA: TA system VapC family ribonuclease toxin [Solirubrobacteraceae bacterium]|nr:TA system VapC family ribonuclease toxin [Solirubrobacteraceae bacterium]